MFLMMGSADELPAAPVEKPRFIEDMSEDDVAAAVSGFCNEVLHYTVHVEYPIVLALHVCLICTCTV